MAASEISTFFEGRWQEGDTPILKAADHGTWLGTLVFDGARLFEGVAPDLDLHCARIVASAEAMGMNAPVTADEIAKIARERLKGYGNRAVYIRPMMWPTDSAPGLIAPDPDSTAWALCFEDMEMPEPGDYALGVSTYRRPRQDMAICDAKAACLYANNGRIMREARQAGYHNAISLDIDGNVAETASSNVFIVRDGVVFTPVPNGAFLAGITRARVIELLRMDGIDVVETVMTLDDLDKADEMFITANASKITPVTRYKDRELGIGPVALRARALYWEFAHQTGS